MSTIRIIPHQQYQTVRIVVKGAPEYLIPFCCETFDFKIEETVATPEMIKHLVGDNTPDEEEEMIKPAMAEKKAEHPKVQAPPKVEV